MVPMMISIVTCNQEISSYVLIPAGAKIYQSVKI
jgi:hypothetical protein